MSNDEIIVGYSNATHCGTPLSVWMGRESRVYSVKCTNCWEVVRTDMSREGAKEMLKPAEA